MRLVRSLAQSPGGRTGSGWRSPRRSTWSDLMSIFSSSSVSRARSAVMSASLEPGFIAGIGGDEIAVVEVADSLLGPVGAVAMLFGGLLATASSANASILASSRINFAMGRDKIITPSLNEVHSRFSTPYKSIAITGGLICNSVFYPDGLSELRQP